MQQKHIRRVNCNQRENHEEVDHKQLFGFVCLQFFQELLVVPTQALGLDLRSLVLGGLCIGLVVKLLGRRDFVCQGLQIRQQLVVGLFL